MFWWRLAANNIKNKVSLAEKPLHLLVYQLTAEITL